MRIKTTVTVELKDGSSWTQVQENDPGDNPLFIANESGKLISKTANKLLKSIEAVHGTSWP